MGTASYYHYTSADLAGKINKSQKIKASGLHTPDDKSFGPGSYFTKMDPAATRNRKWLKTTGAEGPLQ